LDVLTKYVVDEGLSAKLRELRHEFFSKTDFKTVEGKFLTHRMLDDVANSIRGEITKHADKLKVLKKGQEMNRENMTKLKDQVDKCI